MAIAITYLERWDGAPRNSISLIDRRGEITMTYVGAMICHDREFPEIARILMLEGAELILTPNACDLEANRIGQFRARAFENMVGVAMANYAAPQANGRSTEWPATPRATPAIRSWWRPARGSTWRRSTSIRYENTSREVWGNAYNVAFKVQNTSRAY
jgi:predicted amidohydrolase